MSKTEPANTAERARRTAVVWARDPNLSESQVLETVDAELELEAQDRADRDQWADEYVASVSAMLGCAMCGAFAPGRSAFCRLCDDANTLLRLEAAGESLVNGRRRRDLAVAYREKRKQDRQKAG